MAAIQARSRRVVGGGLVRAVVNDGTDPDTLGGHVENRVPVTPCVPGRIVQGPNAPCRILKWWNLVAPIGTKKEDNIMAEKRRQTLRQEEIDHP